MPALYVNLQVRQRLHDLLVKQTNPVAAFVVFAPSFIVILCRIAEGAENTFKVVRVFQANVLLNRCDASRLPVFI